MCGLRLASGVRLPESDTGFTIGSRVTLDGLLTQSLFAHLLSGRNTYFQESYKNSINSL